MIPEYPLTWPDTLPRARSKANSQFKATLSAALKNVHDSMRRFAADSGTAIKDVAISSNVTLGQANPADSGVAVWFMWDGEQRCIAVDRYPKVQDNLQAIHHIIEARRTELRHGGMNVVRQTFKGFTALPAPKGWREVLGFKDGDSPTPEEVKRTYRTLASAAHPDRGGSAEAMSELNLARDRAFAEIGC